MIVTKDRYRLPVCWGTSEAELARRAGLRPNSVHSMFSKIKSGAITQDGSRYEIVDIDEEGEDA